MTSTSTSIALKQGPRMTFDGFSRRPDTDPGPRGAAAASSPEDAAAADDAALVALVSTGDGAAFEILVERHQRAVIGYLVGLLGDRDEALDAAQEVFVRLFTRADKYVPSGSFRAWLFRIATNVAIDAIRSRRRRFFGWSRRQKRPPEASRLAPDDLAELPDPRGTALDDVVSRERDEAVRRAVQSLPSKYCAALVLRDLQDLSYEEVAEALGIRVGTVKSRINRARNLLRDRLVSHAGDAP